MSDSFPQAEIMTDAQLMQRNGSLHVSALTLLLYDTIYLVPKEIKHIHRGPWSLIRILYLSLRIWSFIRVTTDIYISQSTFLPQRTCVGIFWVGAMWDYVQYLCAELLMTQPVVRMF